jgi:hypothetical protein
MYIHVHVVMYLYVHDINMSVPCSDTYVLFCPILSRWVGFQMEDLKSVGAPMPLGQKHTVWIRTGNLSLA